MEQAGRDYMADDFSFSTNHAEESRLDAFLEEAVLKARGSNEGKVADYIPEIAAADPELTSVAVQLVDGTTHVAGDADEHRFTLQSSAKLIVLAGLLSELGADRVFAKVGAEPSGGAFASIARLDDGLNLPSNPLINTGAIALCGLVEGHLEARIAWLEAWAAKLCGARLAINHRVLASERRTGHRNRAIAHLLSSCGQLDGPIDDVLDTYFSLCSLEASVREAVYLPALLARGGMAPDGERILSAEVASQVISVMATCGMYDESGTYLLNTGMPAKSGVSGTILAVALGRAGVAVSSPRVNERGGSVRGHIILEALSREFGWHFGLTTQR